MARETSNAQELVNVLKEEIDAIIPKALDIIGGFVESTMKPQIISRCPSESEEAMMLSMDTSGVGTPEGDRFLRDGSSAQGMSLRQALALEMVYRGNDYIGFGENQKLIENTIFSWYNKTYDEIRSTQPFNFEYVDALEWGGTWRVMPRQGTKALSPEDGVFRAHMTKQIYPHLMFTNGSNAVIPELLIRLSAEL